MDNQLVVSNGDLIKSVDDLLRLGTALLKSGLIPQSVKTPDAAAAIILKGRELGIGAMEALSSINVILGKPTTSPQLMLALARRTKEFDDMKIDDDGQKCVVTIKRRGQSPVTTSFSMDDAKSMGLLSKDNWNKQPKTMRQWRALAANLRVTFPDAISGLYTYEEMGAEVDVTEEGQMTITKLPDEPIQGQSCVFVEHNPAVSSPNVDTGTGEIVEKKHAPHWIDSETQRKMFWSSAKNFTIGNSHKLTEDEVHKVLGVTSMREYNGTQREAVSAIAKYVNEESKKLHTKPTVKEPPRVDNTVEAI